MSQEVSVTILTCLMGIGVMILLAGIPWAYSVHGRLSKIEAGLKDRSISVKLLAELERRVTRLETRQETGVRNVHPE